MWRTGAGAQDDTSRRADEALCAARSGEPAKSAPRTHHERAGLQTAASDFYIFPSHAGDGARHNGDDMPNLPDLAATRWIAAALFVATAAAAAGSSFPAQADSAPAADPRQGDAAYERSQRLFSALKDILDEAARERLRDQTDPSSPISEMMWRQLGLDRQGRVKELLGSAFEMMTDAPVVALREKIDAARGEIEIIEGRIAQLKEQRIAAPKDGGWESWVGLSDDQDSLTSAIEDLERRIAGQEAQISETKQAFADAMAAAGAPLPPDQVDLLLDGVTSADLVDLAAAYDAVRGVSEKLRRLMDESGEDLAYAKRYYGMHTALIALLAEAQTQFLQRIEQEYQPKLDAIERDIQAAARQTQALLKDDPTPDQRRALAANRRSQKVALDALHLYRDYLDRQRAQIAAALQETVKELRVADNTLRTVDASFQLRQLMESASASFDALRSMESPGFERLFENDQLRREFQELTDRLAPGS